MFNVVIPIRSYTLKRQAVTAPKPGDHKEVPTPPNETPALNSPEANRASAPAADAASDPEKAGKAES
jgi:hypothetical protein